MLANSGHTPAHKVTYWALAEILPFPLPEGRELRAGEDKLKSSFVLGPRQEIQLNAPLPYYVPDEDVSKIKNGKEIRVHVWSEVSYEDIFEIRHTTKFCHCICWVPWGDGERVLGTYANRHTEAT